MASAKERKQKFREKYIAQYGYEKFREMENARNSVCRNSKKQKMSALEQAAYRERARIQKAKWRASKKPVVASPPTDILAPQTQPIFTNRQSQGKYLVRLIKQRESSGKAII